MRLIGHMYPLRRLNTRTTPERHSKLVPTNSIAAEATSHDPPSLDHSRRVPAVYI